MSQGFAKPLPGVQGPQGAQGVQGPQGGGGPQAAVYDVFGNIVQVNLGAQGPQGLPSSVPGPQGAQGPQGGGGPQAIVRDVNGNLFQVNNGVQGAQGTQGPQGAAGTSPAAVAARYTSSSAQSLSLAEVNIGYATQVFDTHNAASGTGSTWKWTVPVTGYYVVMASLDVSTGVTGSQYEQLYIKVNGVQMKASTTRGFTSGQTPPSLETNTVLSLVAGNEVTVSSIANLAGSRTTSGNPLWDVFCIAKVG
jgi:hypothetical protein